MTWITKLLGGVTLVASTLLIGNAGNAAAVGALAPGGKLASGTAAQPVHYYHRRCRWSNRWGRHRHRGDRIRFCDRRPGITFGFYYGSDNYWGSRRGYNRGYRRDRRWWRNKRRPGFISGQDARPRARFRGNRINRQRFRGNRQFQRFRGGGQRQLRRRRSDLPATYVLTSFGGMPEVIGTLPVKV